MSGLFVESANASVRSCKEMSEASAARITIRLNGVDREISSGSTVTGLLGEIGMDRSRVAVERNRDVVPKARYDVTIIEAGDQLEIVGFVGGGQ